MSAVKKAGEKFCTECGEVINEKAEICPKCGVRQGSTTSSNNGIVSAPNGKTRITAALLAFFLGGLGAHKFYLGNVGMGILYLLMCWTFIPAIVAFIEFIILITMSDDVFIAKYGQGTV